MTYMPPVSAAAMRRAERRFLVFAASAAAAGFLVVAATLLPTPVARLAVADPSTACGGYLALAAIVQATWFDVERSANPRNQLVDPSARRAWVNRSEQAFRIAGVVGGVLALVGAVKFLPA